MTDQRLLKLSLSGADTHLTVAPYRGAIATSLVIQGRELLYLDESTFIDPNQNVRGGIPVLFPTPGKLENDRWNRDGLQGEMKQHGFARHCAWTVTAQSGDSVTLSLQSNAATLVQYPWPFEMTLRFQLQATQLRIETRVRNKGIATMPFALGFHPYFEVADKKRARIRSDATSAFDNVTHSTGPFHGFDLAVGEVDVHLIDHPDSHLALELGDGTQIVVSAAQDYRRWVVWTLPGKDFVCVEPWTAPGNALNSSQDLLTLPPGGTYEAWVAISLLK